MKKILYFLLACMFVGFTSCEEKSDLDTTSDNKTTSEETEITIVGKWKSTLQEEFGKYSEIDHDSIILTIKSDHTFTEIEYYYDEEDDKWYEDDYYVEKGTWVWVSIGEKMIFKYDETEEDPKRDQNMIIEKLTDKELILLKDRRDRDNENVRYYYTKL